jgi:hypothetical protein
LPVGVRVCVCSAHLSFGPIAATASFSRLERNRLKVVDVVYLDKLLPVETEVSWTRSTRPPRPRRR